ncbi:MAG: hypothetical protein NW220_14640 [Leptolyngbyaceae cyanobacterium bins.349]|nr:hypothetical protein [Leptolyngbyaceae cyanobacterium bins.349]
MTSYSRYSHTVAVNPYSQNHAANHAFDAVISVGIFLLPIFVVISFLSYKQRRVKTLQQQIAQLERLWLLSPKNTQ